jgi:mRNA-degrading endonuclease RelE of RelBE toxin-antitoxin system
MSVSYAYKKVFTENGFLGDDAIFDRMAMETKGYAYAFQLLGYMIWDNDKKNIDQTVLDSCREKYKSVLFSNAYTRIMQELSETDRKVLYCMADENSDTVEISTIMARMNCNKSYMSRYRQRLLDSRILYSSERGRLSFALPYFRAFTDRYREFYEI